MNDFVTRLEVELHRAALRREQAGRVRGVALPRLRVALRDVPVAAVATVFLGLAVTAVALMLSASPERPANIGMPAELRGVWQAPPKELRLYARGAERCVNLGLGGSEPCYTFGDSASGVAYEWGTLSIDGDELTLRATQDSTPGVYRWRLHRGALRLTKLDDPHAGRARALATVPLRPLRRSESQASRARLPVGWASHQYTSKRFGYSILLPVNWLSDPGGPTDRFARRPSRHTLPEMSVLARDLPAGTSPARWAVVFDSRLESACAPSGYFRRAFDGAKMRVSLYRGCDGVNVLSASFMHGGRGYGVLWRGSRPPERDYPLFDALLNSLSFPP